MSVLVVGSVAFDSVETPFGKVEEALGGSATFFSAAASFQAGVQLVAVVGQDFDVAQLEFLQQRGVSLDGLEVAPGQTFRWKGHYGYDLNEAQTLATHLNVFEGFNPKLNEQQRDAQIVFLANIDPSLQLSVLEQVRKPDLVAMDTMNFWIDSARDKLTEVLKRVDMLVINDSEARMLGEEANTVKAAMKIRDMGPQIVVIKRGEYGALMLTHEHFFFVPAFPLESVFDPTGAGDTFAGGLIGTLAAASSINERSLRQGVVVGSVLASFAVERFGLERMKSLSWADVLARYQQMRALTHFEEIDTNSL